MTSTVSRQVASSPSTWPVLHVAGEVDISTAPGLRALLERAAADLSHLVVVDLSAVTFMDCSGLRPLLEAKGRLGGLLWLRGLPRPVTHLLQLAGLHATFRVLDAPTPLCPRQRSPAAPDRLGT